MPPPPLWSFACPSIVNMQIWTAASAFFSLAPYVEHLDRWNILDRVTLEVKLPKTSGLVKLTGHLIGFQSYWVADHALSLNVKIWQSNHWSCLTLYSLVILWLCNFTYPKIHPIPIHFNFNNGATSVFDVLFQWTFKAPYRDFRRLPSNTGGW